MGKPHKAGGFHEYVRDERLGGPAKSWVGNLVFASPSAVISALEEVSPVDYDTLVVVWTLSTLLEYTPGRKEYTMKVPGAHFWTEVDKIAALARRHVRCILIVGASATTWDVTPEFDPYAAAVRKRLRGHGLLVLDGDNQLARFSKSGNSFQPSQYHVNDARDLVGDLVHGGVSVVAPADRRRRGERNILARRGAHRLRG